MSNEITGLEISVRELAKQVTALDKVVARLASSIEHNDHQEKELTKTVRNMDNSLNDLALKFEAEPMARHRTTEIAIEPLWNRIHKHEEKFMECEERVSRKLTQQLFYFIITVVFFSGIIGTGGTYIYIKDMTDMQKHIDNNSNHIEDHHKRHQ